MTYQTSEWLPRPHLITARIGLAGATADGSVYAISGFAGNHMFRSVEVRSRRDDPAWHEAPALTTARANSAADTVDHLVYVVGGLLDGVPTKSVERFDPRTNGPWRASRDLPKPRAQAGVAAHGKLLYVVGGVENDGTRSMVAYDVNKDRWIDRAPLPGPTRFLLRLVEARDHLYAIGGFDSTTELGQTLVDRYDPAHDHWERMAPLKEPRGNCGVAAFGRGRRHIVAVGGVDRFGTGTPSRSSEVYDVDANEWETLNVLLAHGRASLVCALEDRNTVLAIGGAVRQDDGTSTPSGLVEAIHIRVSDDDDDDDDDQEDD